MNTSNYSSNGTNDLDEFSRIELIEAKLAEAVEGLTEKNAKFRVKCLNTIIKHFMNTILDNFLERYQETLLDALEKIIKRGSDKVERKLAAHLLSNVIMQLDFKDDEVKYYDQFSTLLSNVIKDTKKDSEFRSACCVALATLTFFTNFDKESISRSMDQFSALFKKSCLKGDGTSPILKPGEHLIHATALSSWCLLATITSQSIISQVLENYCQLIVELLHSNDLQIRMQSGQAICLLLELCGRDAVEDLIDVYDLIDRVKDLATESSKSRSKRDKKEQKSFFRDVLLMVDEGVSVDESHQFSVYESRLIVDSWAVKVQFDFLKSCLGSGISFQMTNNVMIRELFQLGAVQIQEYDPDQSSRAQENLHRHYLNKANKKFLKQSRNVDRNFKVEDNATFQ